LRNSVADTNGYCDRDSYTYSYRNWYANSDSNANGYSNDSASDADSNSYTDSDSASANTNSYGNWHTDRAASAHPRAQRDASRHPTASAVG
jgi:hypothetical protein